MITKKIKDEYLDQIILGNKTFEIRREDDVKYLAGMHVCLKGSTRSAEVLITYELRNCPQYGLEDGYCIFSFELISHWENK